MQEATKQKMFEEQQKQMNVARELEDRYFKKLKETVLGFIPSPRWFAAVKAALNYASPVSLGIPPVDLEVLINKLLFGNEGGGLLEPTDISLSFYEFAVLSNNLEARTPNELGMGLYEYASLMVMAHGYSSEWNALTPKLKEEAKNEYIAENQTKNAAINGAASGPGAFKVVKGEA